MLTILHRLESGSWQLELGRRLLRTSPVDVSIVTHPIGDRWCWITRRVSFALQQCNKANLSNNTEQMGIRYAFLDLH